MSIYSPQEVQELKTYRGTEPLFDEHFSESIKYEYICPFRKEVLDQPVQTKCQAPQIFFAGCLSFAFEMCGPQYPVCWSVIDDPEVSMEPAPLVLLTIISETDFHCPNYISSHNIKKAALLVPQSMLL